MKLLNIFSILTVVLTEKVSVNLKTHQINLKVLDSVDKFIYRGNNSAAEISQTPSKIPKFQIKISKGNQAGDSQFPFVAELSINTKNAGILCTGSLIARNWILTARHCIADTEAETVLAQLGSADRLSPNRVKIFANKFIFMTASSGRSPDIALFMLVNYVPITNSIKTIRLPSLDQENKKFEGSTITAIGWGGIGGDNFSRYLQYTTFTILSESQCYLAANIICSQPKTGTSSVEGGDSGGTSIIYENGIPTQIGINFFTARSGNTIWQGATRVSDFLRFIQNNTGIPLRQN